MPLKIENLAKVKRRPDGSFTAQCPACLEAGRDQSGNHLFVRVDGNEIYNHRLHLADKPKYAPIDSLNASHTPNNQSKFHDIHLYAILLV